MKDFPIKNFGTKLMVSSKSINNIPEFYLSTALNARIFDGGIGPRRGKSLLLSSTLGTKNRGGFTLGGKLFQVTNSKIYQIDKTTGIATEKATLGYDETVDVLTYGTGLAIIASPGKDVKVYDGVTTVTTPATVPAGFPSACSGILEYCRGYTFLAGSNILYISRPITAANPGYAYDWTGSGAQNITYDTPIKALKATMNGLYVFLEDRVEFLGANALQNVAGSATFISTPLGDSSYPMSNLCVAAAGDKIFWVSKNLQVMTLNYTPGIANAQIGELSARPVISIKEFLNTISTVQPSSFAFFNENDKTIQFHLRSSGVGFNDKCLIYDIVNGTWNVDTGKNYDYVVKDSEKYWGFSDVNSSVYQDDVGRSDAGVPIGFRVITQNMTIGTYAQKLFGGALIQGGIGNLTTLDLEMTVDAETVFADTVDGAKVTGSESLTISGEIGGESVGGEPIGGDLTYDSTLTPFDFLADEGRIYQAGTRVRFDISSPSQIQDFILDRIGVRADVLGFVDIQKKF